MDPCPASAAVWIDADYDREHATGGHSRYGAYVRDRLGSFAECWDGSYDDPAEVQFAATAWRVATGPIMVPGYVRCHPRILTTELEPSSWDCSLLAQVDLITPWPRPLTDSRRWMAATDRGWWRDWQLEFGGTYYAPTDEDLTKAPYLLTSARCASQCRPASFPSRLPAIPERNHSWPKSSRQPNKPWQSPSAS